MKTVKVKPSTILSFYTGRLYSVVAPTILFGEMLCVAAGVEAVYTHELPEMKTMYSEAILSQCPAEFQRLCTEWVHDNTWAYRVGKVDADFPEFEITRCI